MTWMIRSKTIWSAVGLFGLALYQLMQGEYPAAIQSFLGALAAFGLRDAIQRLPAP